MIASTFAEAWRIYREQFKVIAAVVIVVWLPCDLLSSYLDAFVFDPEDFRRSFQVERFLEAFIGIIATGGVTFLALMAQAGTLATFGRAVGEGFSAWGRLWWSRFLAGLFVLLGLLLLIVPGIYLGVRLCFVDSIAVVERLSGGAALQRSFTLTHGRFWPVFRLNVVLTLLIVVSMLLLYLPVVLIPALDHWLVDAAILVICDVLAAFVTVAYFCGYQARAREVESA